MLNLHRDSQEKWWESFCKVP